MYDTIKRSADLDSIGQEIMSEEVRRMFSAISGKYDMMNDLLSFGVHRRWRRTAVKLSRPAAGDKILDCACGTGDMTIEYKKALGGTGKTAGVDFCRDMIELAGAKAAKANLDIDFSYGDLSSLHFGNNEFDLASIAFGVRNLDSPLQGLKEMARVVRPGGKIVVLEFGRPEGFFALLYRMYSKLIIPSAGKIFANDAEAYRYLPETAAIFPCKNDFIELMKKTGVLRDCVFYPVSGGVAYIYIGVVD